MKLGLHLVAGLLLAAGPLKAGEAQNTSQNGESVGYNDAVEKCLQFNNDPQIVKIKFKVTCFDENFSWRQTESRMITTQSSGYLGHRIVLKEKWHTPDFLIPMVHDPVNVACPVLTKYSTTRQADIVVSCDELATKYVDPADLIMRCDESLVKATPYTEPTEDVVDLCAFEK